MVKNTAFSIQNGIIDAQSFASFLASPAASLDLDLSNSSLVEVLERYQQYKRKTSPRYSISSVITNVKKMEEVFGVVIMPNKVNDIFNAYFVSYLLGQGIQGNTIQTYFSQMRAALKWGSRHRCPITSTFDDFNIPPHKNTKYALTPDDVSYIYHFDFRSLTKVIKVKDQVLADVPSVSKKWSNGKVVGAKTKMVKRLVDVKVDKTVSMFRADHIENLERIRDMFCLSCNLMQRYSDMRRITPACFNEAKTLYVTTQQKTGNKAYVNIKDMCLDPKMTREILERYNYSSPYTGDINAFNARLHEILKLVGGKFVTTMIKSENKINGEIVSSSKPLYEVIASHAGRRTGITYNVNRGISEAKIRQASGHQDSRSFCKYIIYNED